MLWRHVATRWCREQCWWYCEIVVQASDDAVCHLIMRCAKHLNLKTFSLRRMIRFHHYEWLWLGAAHVVMICWELQTCDTKLWRFHHHLQNWDCFAGKWQSSYSALQASDRVLILLCRHVTEFLFCFAGITPHDYYQIVHTTECKIINPI